MKRLAVVFFSLALLALTSFAQGPSGTGPKPSAAPKVFRANKEQVKEVQTKLKASNLYSGEITGKLDNATRAAIKQWQGDNGLKRSGTLNRMTLEKMGVELTESQKLVPVSPPVEPAEKTEAKAGVLPSEKPKRSIFRATKDQIIAAQKKLKAENLFSGDETGKLDAPTRSGLKKYQESNGLKVSGTLNQVTLEKMGIELTEKQKAAAPATPSK